MKNLTRIQILLMSFVIPIFFLGCSHKILNTPKSIAGVYELGESPDESIYFTITLKTNGECIWYKKYVTIENSYYGKWSYKDGIVYAKFPDSGSFLRYLEYPPLTVEGQQKFIHKDDFLMLIVANGDSIISHDKSVYKLIK